MEFSYRLYCTLTISGLCNVILLCSSFLTCKTFKGAFLIWHLQVVISGGRLLK